MCVARALTERQDPHDASEPRALIGDELITLQQGIAMLNAAIRALDLVRS